MRTRLRRPETSRKDGLGRKTKQFPIYGRSCDESSTTLSAYKGSFGLFLVFSALLLLGCQIQPQVGQARALQVVVRGWYVMAFQLVPACKQAVERRLVLVNGIDLGERWRSIGPSDLGAQSNYVCVGLGQLGNFSG